MKLIFWYRSDTYYPAWSSRPMHRIDQYHHINIQLSIRAMNDLFCRRRGYFSALKSEVLALKASFFFLMLSTTNSVIWYHFVVWEMNVFIAIYGNLFLPNIYWLFRTYIIHPRHVLTVQVLQCVLVSWQCFISSDPQNYFTDTGSGTTSIGTLPVLGNRFHCHGANEVMMKNMG